MEVVVWVHYFNWTLSLVTPRRSSNEIVSLRRVGYTVYNKWADKSDKGCWSDRILPLYLKVTVRLLFTEKMTASGFNIFSNTPMVSHPTSPVTWKPADRFSCNRITQLHWLYTFCDTNMEFARSYDVGKILAQINEKIPKLVRWKLFEI